MVVTLTGIHRNHFVKMIKGLFVCLLFPSLGEAHFSAYQKPLLYFEVLFLTGQFEAVSLHCSGNPILTIVHWRFYSFAGSKVKVSQFIDLGVVIIVYRTQLNSQKKNNNNQKNSIIFLYT